MHIHLTRKLLLLFTGAAILSFLLFRNPKVTTDMQIFAQDTPMQTELIALHGAEPGNAVLIVGGIHGDERSGIEAAQRLAKELRPTSGTVYILSVANRYGVENDLRRTADNWDLNRIFPGHMEGDDSQLLAAELMAFVQEVQPDLVIDLHEALRERDNWDNLGDSFVFTSADKMEELLLDLLEKTASGTLASNRFGYFDSAPKGSLNYELTTRMAIPALTIEASSTHALEQRVENHLAIVYYILDYYEIT